MRILFLYYRLKVVCFNIFQKSKEVVYFLFFFKQGTQVRHLRKGAAATEYFITPLTLSGTSLKEALSSLILKHLDNVI